MPSESVVVKRVDAPHNFDKTSFLIDPKESIVNPVPRKSREIIALDENDEYTFSQISLSQIDHRVFYDGEEKIAELFHEQGQLIIKCLTKKQVNIFANIVADECVIETQGPLCIDGKLQIRSSLELSAESACILDQINCDGFIELKVPQVLDILAPISAKDLVIHASLLHQNADITTSGLYDVSAQTFQQKSEVKTQVNSLRLLIDRCELNGDLSVADKCFLKSSHLLIGDEHGPATIQLLGASENRIHVANCIIRGDTQVTMSGTTDVDEFIVDELLLLAHDNSVLDLKALTFDAGQVSNKGELVFNNVIAEIDDIKQDGIFTVEQSDVTVYDSFYQGEDATTDAKKSLLSNKHSSIKGEFSLIDSELIGETGNIFSGLLSLTEQSELHLNESLCIDQLAKCVVDNSRLNVAREILANGKVNIKDSEVNAGSFRAYKEEVSLESSKLGVASQLMIAKGVRAAKSALTGDLVSLQGPLNIDDLFLRASTLQFKSEQADIKKCIANTEQLILDGSKEKGKVNFEHSDLVAKRVMEWNHVTLNKSCITGIGHENAGHEIHGKMKLIGSRFITNSQTYLAESGKTKLIDHSTLQAGRVVSNAKLKVNDSTIFSNVLLQNSGDLQANNSSIRVKEKTFLRSGNTILSKNTTMTSDEMYNESHLRMTDKSFLKVDKKIVTSAMSHTESNHSIMQAENIVMQGRADLVNSLLSAEELLIYHQFTAKQSSQINAKKRVSLAAIADAKLEQSSLATKEFESFGELRAEDSKLVAEQLNAWSDSKTSLVGSSEVNTDSLLLRGKLETKSKKVTVAKLEKKSTPQIKVKELFDIAKQATIAGDDLIVEAHTIEQAGTVNLDSLHAKGVLFYHPGSSTVKNLFLGFDDAVVNTGSLSGKNLTIHSNFFNIFGSASAEQRFSVSGLVNFNLGLVAANNYSANSVFSLNAGLVLPNFSADPRYIFSGSNLISLGKAWATSFAPNYTNTINLVSMLPNLWETGSSLINSGSNLINAGMDLYNIYQQQGWQATRKVIEKKVGAIISMRPHEIIPLFCQAKDTLMLGYGAFSAAKGAWNETAAPLFKSTDNETLNPETVAAPNEQDHSAETAVAQQEVTTTTQTAAPETTDASTSNASNDSPQSGFGEIYEAAQPHLINLGRIFGGNYTDNSIFHLNSGANLSVNINKSNFFHCNTGVERSLLTHSIDTSHLYNSGLSGGAQANFQAKVIDNSGGLFGTHKFVMKADQVNNMQGDIYGRKVEVDIKKLNQQGGLDFKKGKVEITEFKDAQSAATCLEELEVKGRRFDLEGVLQGKKVTFSYDEYFHAAAGSNMLANNMAVNTKDYCQNGNLSYENTMSIVAETAKFAAGSTVNGLRTDEDKLFKPVNDSLESELATAPTDGSTEALDTANKEPETQFSPQHILTVVAKKVTVAGKMRGGDYTNIKGHKDEGAQNLDEASTEEKTDAALLEKIDELIIEESADVELQYGSIAGKKAGIAGHVKLDNFNIAIDHAELAKKADLSLAKGVYTGDSFKSEGHLNLEDQRMKVKLVELGAQATERFKDSTISTEKFVDASQLAYEGKVFISSDQYSHTGRITHIMPPEPTAARDLFSVTANTGNLQGSADIDNGHYNIKQLAQAREFITGEGGYANYQFKDSLFVETEQSIGLHQAKWRDCDLSVRANEIAVSADYNMQHALAFISTAGNVALTGNINASSLYGESAGHIYTNKNINTDGLLQFEAKGGYYNLGGTLNGDIVAVKAAEVINITQGSKLGKRPLPFQMGATGIINGRSKTLLESTVGNIENHGGIIRSNGYTQLLAKGSVLNLCNTRSSKGKHDTIKAFDPGLIAGGNGSTTDGVGLYIKANGKVVSDASDFVSGGDNYIEGLQGVEFKARHHTYISRDEVKKSGIFNHKKKHVIETSTNIKGSLVQSTHGRNIIRSENGGVSSIATCFQSPGGTDIRAQGEVKLFSLKTQDKKYKSESSFWGLNSSKRKEMHESATPTLFIDNGLTRIHSVQGGVDARGALFLGEGDLSIKAAKRIQLGVDILSHEISQKTRSIGVSIPGMGAWNSLNNDGGLWGAATAEDATLAKMNSMWGAQNPAELLASATNLGIDLVNTSSSLMRGIAGDTLCCELMARYGLGGAEGFSPSVKLSMTHTKTRAKYQTQGLGGVDRDGNVKLEAGEGVDLENGVKVKAGKDLEVDAPELIAKAAQLNSSFEQTSQGINVGFNPTAGVTDVGGEVSTTKSTATHYENAGLSAGDNVKLHHQGQAMQKIELDGAMITAKTLDMDVKQLIITDKQNESHVRTVSAAASTSGQVSFSQSETREKVVGQHAGFNIEKGLNTDGHVARASEVYMRGGVIETAGENHFEAGLMVTKELKDERKSNGIGVSFNVNDITRLLSEQKPTNATGEKAIATATITIDHQHYEAVQTPVVYGQQGTTPSITNLVGPVHTTSNNGSHVIQDTSLHLAVDVPITNQAYLQQAADNIKRGTQELAKRFNPVAAEKAKDFNDVSIPEPIAESFAPAEEIDQGFEESYSDISQQQLGSNDAVDIVEPTKTDQSEVELENQENKSFEITSKIAQDGSASPDVEISGIDIIDPGYDPDTFDAKIAWKKGRNGNQMYDPENGQYDNPEGVKNRIKEQNDEKEMITTEVKISIKCDFLEADNQVYLSTEGQWGNESHIIKPSLVDDNGHGYFAAEFDPINGQLDVQLSAGRVLRLTLAQGSQDICGLGKCEYAVDAAKLMAVISASCSGEQGLQAGVAVGALGPNAGGTFKSTEISLFGFTLQLEASGQIGVGAKVAIDGGLTFDKNNLKLKPHLKLGAYCGGGGQAALTLTLGIDKKYQQLCIESINEIASRPENKAFMAELQQNIHKAEQAMSSSAPWYQRVWHGWEINCWEEALAERWEQIANEAKYHLSSSVPTTGDKTQADLMKAHGLFKESQPSTNASPSNVKEDIKQLNPQITKI